MTDAADDTTVLTDYAYNTDAYLVPFPSRVRLQDANNATLRQSWTYYDGATDWTVFPVKGMYCPPFLGG